MAQLLKTGLQSKEKLVPQSGANEGCYMAWMRIWVLKFRGHSYDTCKVPFPSVSDTWNSTVIVKEKGQFHVPLCYPLFLMFLS